jgi:hypothetical protein
MVGFDNFYIDHRELLQSNLPMQSPILKCHLIIVLSQNISYEFNKNVDTVWNNLHHNLKVFGRNKSKGPKGGEP